MSHILPYKNLGETIELSFDFGSIPYSELGDAYLLDAGGGGPVKFDVAAQLPASVSDVLAKGEDTSKHMEVLASLVSVDGALRQGLTLKPIKKNLFSATAEIDPAVCVDSVRVSVLAVRAQPGGAVGLARHKGARLAWSPKREVRFTPRPPNGSGRNLKVVWEDFSKSAVVPGGFEDAMFHLDTTAEPALYLNSMASAPMIKLLEAQGHGIAHSVPRDAVFQSIALSAWTQLATVALAAVRDEAQTGTPVELTALSQWKADVVRFVAPHMFPQMLPDTAIALVCDGMDDPSFFAKCIGLCPAALQRALGFRKAEEKLAEWVHA